jgi:hypothetical protein
MLTLSPKSTDDRIERGLRISKAAGFYTRRKHKKGY